MKALKITVIIIGIALLLSGIGVALFWASFDANRYIPQVADAVFQATGRQIKIGNASLKMAPDKGMLLELKDITLSDAPAFSDKPFFTMARVDLGVDLMALLTEKKIVVSHIDVGSPRVVIIRGKDGAVNAAAMASSASAGDPKGGAVAAASAPPAGAAALPVLLVREFTVNDGTVTYIDRSFEPALELSAEKMSLTIKGFSLTAPFAVKAAAAVLSPSANVTLAGTARVDLAGSKVIFSDGHVSLALDALTADRLNAAVASIRPLGFRSATGNINAAVKELSAGTAGLLTLDAALETNIHALVLGGGNIFAAALNAIPLPGLADAVIADMPAATQQDIRNGVSVIDLVAVRAALSKDTARLISASIVSRELEVTAQGSVLFSGRLALQGHLFITGDVSAVMMKKAGDLSAIQESDGRIRVPFAVGGALSAPQIRPDAEYLARKLLLSRGKMS